MANDPLKPSRPVYEPAYKAGPHWVAVVAACFTWPLIFVGGSVTTYRVGMAVPDWPTTFGINMFLYDFWNAPFGVRVEHTHRLYGAAVGLSTLILAVWFLAADQRRLMKWLGVLALVTVIGQGVLGGTRVTQNSTVLAAVHGVTGQAFFALMVSLCVLTGRDWIMTAPARADTSHLRRRSAVTLFLVAVQIAVGAWLRHFPWMASTSLIAHALLALAVWGHAAMLALRVERSRGEIPELVPSSRAMALAVMLQVVLGVASWWMLRPFDGIPRTVTIIQAMVRTGHQANGALLLAASVVLTFRAFRHLAPAHKTPSWSSQSAPGLEVVA
ncbi:COX15/CtaA family protein [Singulisphaera sp. Ch08]|uniref:COX15/CtaA family protein n=1 Tax=Singulisphaera sp. Ch08 TaxID=3120278 RepID=A0AAU7C7X1_9BACT